MRMFNLGNGLMIQPDHVSMISELRPHDDGSVNVEIVMSNGKSLDIQYKNTEEAVAALDMLMSSIE